MKKSLVGIGLLVMLINIPFFLGLGVTWSIMHYTGTGFLVGMGTVTTVADNGEGENGATKEVVECPYLTSSGFIEAVVDHKGYGFGGQLNCPWRIDLPA